MSEPISWTLFAIVIGVFLALDLSVISRERGRPTIRSAVGWVVVWVSLALSFGGLIWATRGSTSAGEYLAGYLVEYSLSADNIFVFAMLFAYLAVPAEYQRRLLFWGVLGAIFFRTTFVLAGIAMLEAFHALIYVFGAVLVVGGVRMASARFHAPDPAANPLLRFVRRHVPMTSDYRSGAFVIRVRGRLLATPMLAALLVVESTDVVFAIDSVPAILAITTDPFIVITSNAFAILGLRSLYFVLAGMLDRFLYLRIGLGAILVFAGLKMAATDLIQVPIPVSLAVIAFLLIASVAASLWATRHRISLQPARRAG